MFKKSIKTKLSLFFGALAIAICIGLGVISYIDSANALISIINESLLQMANEAAKVIHSRVEARLDALEVLAENSSIKDDELTLDEKLKLLENEVKRSGHLSLAIVDTNGNLRGTDGGNVNISDREYFKKALAGESAVSDPIVSKANNKVVICYAVPIKDGSAVKGVLVASRDGNELSSLSNDIRFGKSGYAFMINDKGTTVAHKDKNLVMNMDNDFENVKKDPELKSLVELEKQMVAGKEGVGEYTYQGVTKYMGFAPVEGTNWSLAITAPKSEVMAKANALAAKIIIVSILFLIFSIIITILISSGISKPIKKASDILKIVANGDFTMQIPPELLNMQDETGVLANAIHSMQKSIKEIVKEVIEQSTNVGQMLININTDMGQLNKSIEQISATTQELSAGTEETASSTEEMSATSSEIEKAAESIASNAQECASSVSDVYNMAEEMRKNAAYSKKNAVEIYEKAKADLQKALEQSKAVSQVNELSEAILGITSQTNLLALNAAIEAARAGEAGRGFTVVAEEIRKLAESSKNTVVRIQEVTKTILDAVNNLSYSSGEILEFIDKKVLNDYENLVKAGEQYSRSSSRINEMVTDFSATSEELLASVENLAKAIDEIANASNEEAQGASNIAQEASYIAQMSSSVMNLAESAKNKSDSLIKAVSKFKI
ncbi:MAG: cache domain-containing protein [Tepidanaerobacteraceae bacterium]|jgi:methyl-accepting chemotaxis protein|nr:cache domain-containing protein [Tepidanaerobacteraceae bacterium]